MSRGQASYFQHFPAVEIQKTLYQPPRIETARRWRRQVPPSFRFTLKAWQLITHEPSSPTCRRLARPVAQEAASRLGAFRSSPVVLEAWGGPPGRSPRPCRPRWWFSSARPASPPVEENVRNFSAIFSSLEHGDLRLAWEPRGSWPPGLIRQLYRRFGLIHCVDPFRDACLSDGALYFRLHGIGGYRYRYCDSDLQKLLALCEVREGYVMFNNMTMKEDALRFIELLKGAA